MQVADAATGRRQISEAVDCPDKIGYHDNLGDSEEGRVKVKMAPPLMRKGRGAQYSEASMMVSTRLVWERSVGSGDPYVRSLL